MLLYLAHKNAWVYVTEVFRGADPEGITSLHGARKALRELDYVEMKNVTPGRPTYECRLKQDIDTFAELLNIFIGTEYAEEFLKSAYVDEINNPEIYLIVANTIFDKLKTVHLVCDTFYPDSPLAKALGDIFAPDLFGGLLAGEQICDMCDAASAVADRSTNDVDTITNAVMNELTNKVDNVTSAVKNMFTSEVKPHVHAYVTGLVSERLRWDEIDEKKQLPPPKTVQ